MRQAFPAIVTSALLAVAIAGASHAQDAKAKATLIQNVSIFDGTGENLATGMSVLVEGNKIAKIAKSISAPEDAAVIDGGGRTLMPGLIDAHVHLFSGGATVADVLSQPATYLTVKAVEQANVMLMNGVTTVRDMAGPTFGLKRGIDEGRIPGPRIYPSGAMISQTSGHLDYTMQNEFGPSLGGPIPTYQRDGFGVIVDGVPDMLAAARDQLRRGASQIKLAIGGGVASPTDPIDVTEFTEEEIVAAVAAAENWGTYVSVHGYTDRAVNQAIDAGVKVFEHGQLLSDETLQRIIDKGLWLSFQPFTECNEPSLTVAQNAKQALVCQGTGNVYEFIDSHPELNAVHGTDIFLDPGDGNLGEVKQMERLLKWLSPYKILYMSTGKTGELLKLSGERNPYPGELGVVKEGAYADLLLVDGNPLEDLTAVTDRDNLRIIMKDGVIYKNTAK